MKFILILFIFISTIFLVSGKTVTNTCQANSAATTPSNFFLNCYIHLTCEGGTAQCLNFNETSLIVETSSSVEDRSFKCESNFPIFVKVEFDYGVPIKPCLKMTRHFNNLSKNYQVDLFPELNSSISMTSVKYSFYNIRYPERKVQVLWHFSKMSDEEGIFDYPVSWLGDLTSSTNAYRNVLENYPDVIALISKYKDELPVDIKQVDIERFIFQFASLGRENEPKETYNTKLIANQDIIIIPCVSPRWKTILLGCENKTYCPESGIPVDNVTLYYNPMVGFSLNTTLQPFRGNYFCELRQNHTATATGNGARILFTIEEQEDFTTTSQFTDLGTAEQLIAPPFVHAPLEGNSTTHIIVRNPSTRFDLECSSAVSEVDIIFNEDDKTEPLNVTYTEANKPIKRYTAKISTPANSDEMFNVQCTNKLNNAEILHTWSIRPVVSKNIIYDEKNETLKFFAAQSLGYRLVIRHLECDNLFMCLALVKCVNDPNYGTDAVNCNNDFDFKDYYCDTFGNLETAEVTCKSFKPFKNGILFGAADLERPYQTLYFQGFDNKTYFNYTTPLNAILKITSDLTETGKTWPIPAEFVIKCEAHAFYFEYGIRWSLTYSNGSSEFISDENSAVADFEPNNEDSFNPKSTIKLKFQHSSVVGVTCHAPVLSIRDDDNFTKWESVTINLKLKEITKPVILTKDSLKTIRIGEDSQGPKCEVKGFPQPTVEWIKNGQVYNNTRKENSELLSSGEYNVNSSLPFPIYSKDDAGEYTCIASNIAGFSDKIFTVATDVSGTILIAVSISAIFIIIIVTTILFVSYKRNITKVRREEMKRILEILKGSKEKFNTNTESESYSEEDAHMHIAYDERYELKKHSFFIDYSKVLGRGEFGSVYKGRVSELDNDVAFKTMNNNECLVQLKALTTELKIIMYIGKHENIVQLLGAYTKEIEKGILFVAIEFCALGSLNSYLKSNKGRFLSCPVLNPQDKDQEIANGYTNVEKIPSSNHSIKNILQWCAQIASGMDYLGTKNVVHSDLATRNILLTVDFVVKITDFGLSRKMYNVSEYNKKGVDPLPWRWMAIESLQHLVFTAKSDVWAYGITLWEIFSFGEVPYPGIDYSVHFASQLNSGLQNPKPKWASDELYEVMKKCWDISPANRPAFRRIKLLFENAVENQYELNIKDLEIDGELGVNEESSNNITYVSVEENGTILADIEEVH